MTPNPLSSEHPRPLKITPPTVRLNLAVKKEVHHWSHEPPLGSGEAYLNKTGTEEKERKQNQKGGGGGSAGSDQDRTKEKEKVERGRGWATRRDLTIPAMISLTRRWGCAARPPARGIRGQRRRGEAALGGDWVDCLWILSFWMQKF